MCLAGGGGTPSNTNAGHDIGGRDGGEAHKCGAEQIKIIKDLGTCGAGTPTEIASVQVGTGYSLTHSKLATVY